MWQNFLYVSMDIGEFQTAINAMKELLTLKDKEVDTEILGMLCDVVAKNMTDAKGTEGSVLSTQLSHLLDEISNKVSTAEVWSVFAKFYGDIGDNQKCLEYREKQYRASQQPNWEISLNLFEIHAKAIQELCKCYILENSSKSLWNARTKLKSFLKKSEDSFNATPSYKLLETLLQDVQEREKQIK